jgi:hypothetical protein
MRTQTNRLRLRNFSSGQAAVRLSMDDDGVSKGRLLLQSGPRDTSLELTPARLDFVHREQRFK